VADGSIDELERCHQTPSDAGLGTGFVAAYFTAIEEVFLKKNKKVKKKLEPVRIRVMFRRSHLEVSN
jgi:hypothetical protein